MTKLKDCVVWAVHTLANALPASILAFQYYLKDTRDIVAMVLGVLFFIVAAPLSPLWRLYRGTGEWGKSFRIALTLRSVWSLLLTLTMTARGSGAHFIELYTGLMAEGIVTRVARVTGWHANPEMHWVNTALMTLITGLTLLGVAGVLCLIVKGVWFAVQGPVRRERQGIPNAD